MNKKVSKDIFSESVKLMNRHYLVGDFFRARQDARHILAKNSDEIEFSAAKSILKKTWPDAQALLAGCGCLAFSIAAALLWT